MICRLLEKLKKYGKKSPISGPKCPPNNSNNAHTQENTPQNQKNPSVVAAAKNLSTLYRTMSVNKELQADTVSRIIKRIESNKARYQRPSLKLQAQGIIIPWEVIATIHLLESNADFKKQILNGQDITQVTTIHPKGHGPFNTWEESTIHALTYMRKNFPKQWGIGYALDFLEKWNGLGYRRRGINTPYLWSYTNHYTKGKYTHDGKFDPNAISKQLGAAIILKGLSYDR